MLYIIYVVPNSFQLIFVSRITIDSDIKKRVHFFCKP